MLLVRPICRRLLRQHLVTLRVVVVATAINPRPHYGGSGALLSSAQASVPCCSPWFRPSQRGQVQSVGRRVRRVEWVGEWATCGGVNNAPEAKGEQVRASWPGVGKDGVLVGVVMLPKNPGIWAMRRGWAGMICRASRSAS